MSDNIRVKNLDRAKAIVYLTGRVDVSVSGYLEEKLLQEIEENGLQNIILNMQDVEYMSSSGFRVAIALLRKLKEEGGTLKISNLKPAVKRIFEIIELTTLFDIYDNEDDALTALS